MLKVAIILTVFSMGLSSKLIDITFIFHRPTQLLKSILSMNVVLPLIAILLVGLFQLRPAVEVTLVALSLSPLPPLLPKKVLKTGTETSCIFSLLAAMALISIVYVPLAVYLIGNIFGYQMLVPVRKVIFVVSITILIPFCAGIWLHHIVPVVTKRCIKPISISATILLGTSTLLILINALPSILILIGNGTLVAILVFVIAGLLTGHILGGPKKSDRLALALASASRHPGIAIVITNVAFSNQKQVVATILLYLVINAITAMIYLRFTARMV